MTRQIGKEDEEEADGSRMLQRHNETYTQLERLKRKIQRAMPRKMKMHMTLQLRMT